jgi:hypothetical protein
MAFKQQRFVRHTNAYNAGQISTTFSPDATAVLENGPAIFSYAEATDTFAQIGAADYFAEVVYYLAVNDLIYVVGADASGFYQVATVDRDAGTVTVVSAFPSGVIGTANIQDDAVTNAKIADDAVSLENLDSGIAPSHVVKFADQPTTVGGGAAEAITVTGVAATDLAFVQLVDAGTNTVSIVNAVVTLNTLTVTFSADPGNDAVINYQLLRAAV